MLFWFIKTTIISIVLISVVHYLYLFFKDVLTQPKVKDLLDEPRKEYNSIIETMLRSNVIVDDGGGADGGGADGGGAGGGAGGGGGPDIGVDGRATPSAYMENELNAFIEGNNEGLVGDDGIGDINTGGFNNFSFSMT